MMLNDITDAFKARLYESTSTPLLGSFVLSWIFINHQYILIYMGTFEDKLNLLKNYDFGLYNCKMWALPLTVSLLYIFVYPFVLNPILKFSLKKQKEREDIKKEIEDKKLLTVDQSRELKEQLYKLQEEIDNKNEKIEFQRNKIETLESNIIELEKDLIEKKTPKPTVPTVSTQPIPTAKVPYKKLNNDIDAKFQKKYSDEEINLLRTVYENNIRVEKRTFNNMVDELLNKNVEVYDMTRLDVEENIKSLIAKNAIYQTKDYLTFSDETRKDMREMFKK